MSTDKLFPKIHWLDVGPIPPASVEDCRYAFAAVLGGIDFALDSRGYLVHPCGLQIARRYGQWHVIATGKTCDELDLYGGVMSVYLRARVEWLAGANSGAIIGDVYHMFSPAYDWRIYRIDIAVDGIDITPAQLLEHFRSDFGISLKSCLRHDSWAWAENPQGQTCYLGSRESDRYLRLYNQRGVNRLELQLRGRFAENLTRFFECEFEPDPAGGLTTAFWGLLKDMADFQKWDAWQSLLDGCERLRVLVQASAKSLARSCAWLSRQCASTISAIGAVLPQFIESLRDKRSDDITRRILYYVECLDNAPPDTGPIFVPWVDNLPLDSFPVRV